MAGMMTERSTALSKDPQLAQRLLRQEQQNYIVQGEDAEDYFPAAAQESSREKADVEEGGESGEMGVEELCTVSWEEGEESIPSQKEEQANVKEVHLYNDEKGSPQPNQLLFSQSGDAIVQESEQTC